MTLYPKGSEWRKWDLHIHTPGTKLSDCYKADGDIWGEYIDYLEKSTVQAFGVTDYFSCDNYFALIEKYKIKYPSTKKVFFPNIELRFAEAISKDDSNPNIHMIFDNNDGECTKEQIQKFISKLKILSISDSGADVFCSELKNIRDFESASVTIESLKSALKETFGNKKPYLISFPANNDGVKTTDTTSPRKVKASDTMDNLADLFFGNSKNKEWFLSNKRYDVGDSQPKPVVSGSDAHSFYELERLEGNVINFEPTWIKADLTFRGLKQICFEPETRVFIGAEPPLQERKTSYATKFISKLKINQIKGYNGNNGEWFKDVDIPINPELTVIIGNKGSGKSALVDMIGLLGESKSEEYFSFLSDNRFGKKGYAENFEAEIEWESKTNPKKKKLSDKVDSKEPELVKYLPQSYVEDLTNDDGIIKLREKVEEVVFSHVKQTDRMGKEEFAELLDLKTNEITNSTNSLKTDLQDLNEKIILLEEKDDPTFKEKLKNELKVKEGELESVNQIKLDVVNQPTGGSKEENELKTDCEELGLEIKSIINLKVDVSSIETLSLKITDKIKELEKIINNNLLMKRILIPSKAFLILGLHIHISKRK